MEIKEIIDFIKERFPHKAIDISECMELLKETIGDTMDKIMQEIQILHNKRDLENAQKLLDMNKIINKYEKKIVEFIELLEVDEENIIDEERIEVNDSPLIPDYSAYLVDYNIEHSLYENFTHKRPYGFRINEDTLIEVKTWKDLLIKTCEILFAIDEKKFMSFEHNQLMNGKKCKNFSTDPNLIRKPELIGNKIYIETNISGNGVRNLLLKMLKEYGFKASEFKIYLRADYTELHK